MQNIEWNEIPIFFSGLRGVVLRNSPVKTQQMFVRFFIKNAQNQRFNNSFSRVKKDFYGIVDIARIAKEGNLLLFVGQSKVQ